MKVDPQTTNPVTIPEAELDLRIGGSLVGFSLASLRLRGDRWVSLAADCIEFYAKTVQQREERLRTVLEHFTPLAAHLLGNVLEELRSRGAGAREACPGYGSREPCPRCQAEGKGAGDRA